MSEVKEAVEEMTAVKEEVVIDEHDFNQLVELEKAQKAVGEQLDKVSGAVFRLTKEQDALHQHSQKIAAETDGKRNELMRRYKLDPNKSWKVDLKTRKVNY